MFKELVVFTPSVNSQRICYCIVSSDSSYIYYYHVILSEYYYIREYLK